MPAADPSTGTPGQGTQEMQDTGHTDLVHDMRLNHTGRRMATCSTDRSIRIWDLVTVEGKNRYRHVGTIPNAHKSSVLKVSWANPMFGQILASCGLDNTVRISQESITSSRSREKGEERTWKALWGTVLPDCITDLCFAPRQFGLKLGVSTNEGSVKIMVASGSDIAQWDITSFEPTKRLGQRVGVTCLVWNPSVLCDRETLLLGTESGHVMIWTVHDPSGTQRDKWQQVPLRDEGAADAIEYNAPVTDVAWAPGLGRSYHLIASSSKDGTLRISKLFPITNDAEGKTPVDTGYLGYRVVHVFTGEGVHGYNCIWRLSWNITGTTLASSGDDGLVRLWQQSMGDKDPKTKENTWYQVQQLRPHPTPHLLATDDAMNEG